MEPPKHDVLFLSVKKIGNVQPAAPSVRSIDVNSQQSLPGIEFKELSCMEEAVWKGRPKIRKVENNHEETDCQDEKSENNPME